MLAPNSASEVLKPRRRTFKLLIKAVLLSSWCRAHTHSPTRSRDRPCSPPLVALRIRVGEVAAPAAAPGCAAAGVRRRRRGLRMPLLPPRRAALRLRRLHPVSDVEVHTRKFLAQLALALENRDRRPRHRSGIPTAAAHAIPIRRGRPRLFEGQREGSAEARREGREGNRRSSRR